MKYCLLTSAVLLMAAGCASEPQQPLPLITGLSGSPAQIATDFDGRIEAQFPVGSNAQALADELTNEGFAVNLTGGDPEASDVSFKARRDDPQGKCAEWTVIWRVSGGNLTQVRGDYTLTCS